ncbi:MAG: hypothetical protein K2N05_04295 [Muribaculaceae bacterium]|nr:hypothetical protein [Muribaculaceae bacterium]
MSLLEITLIAIISFLIGAVICFFFSRYIPGKNSEMKDNGDSFVSQENSEETSKKHSSSTTDHKETSRSSERTERLKENREVQNRESILQSLRNIGCNPRENEDENISVAYQGENFLIQLNGAFIRIWDLSWFATKNTDDNFPLLKDAVNYTNFSFGPTIIMHSPDEDGKIIISSRMDVLYSPYEFDNDGYISAILDSFFAIKTTLRSEVTRLINDPSDRTLMNNSIGFDTASLSDPLSPQAN